MHVIHVPADKEKKVLDVEPSELRSEDIVVQLTLHCLNVSSPTRANDFRLL